MQRFLMGLGVLGLLLVTLVIVLFVNYATYRLPPAPDSLPDVAVADVDADAIAARMGAALRFKTVSNSDYTAVDYAPYDAFLSWVTETYPGVHATMDREFINRTPIYRWPGADPDLPPVLFTGHYDVVPVPDETLANWDVDPWAGEIRDGFVWGRGALDDKQSVIGLLEAAEAMIADGVQPSRDIWFIFGEDEEVGGQLGAVAATELLQSRGQRFAWMLDEGSMIFDGVLPGLPAPVASINIAEKGYLTLDLVAKGQSGHSSLPPTETAVGVLANAIAALESNPVPGGLDGTTRTFFDGLAPEFGFVNRMLFANQWLFKGLLESELSKANTTNALLRTTTAPTMLRGSPQENVLAAEAVATVNFRIHPRDTIADVISHVEAVIDDPRVRVVAREHGRDASPVSSAEAAGYAAIRDAALAVYDEVIVVPGLTIAATDVRHYGVLADDAYRFIPLLFGPSDVARLHGDNERVGVAEMAKMVQAYRAIFELL
ncbi:MAG: M20/M25/M40 family metallo-hydrolase [Pseudomonadota bacterium]